MGRKKGTEKVNLNRMPVGKSLCRRQEYGGCYSILNTLRCCRGFPYVSSRCSIMWDQSDSNLKTKMTMGSSPPYFRYYMRLRLYWHHSEDIWRICLGWQLLRRLQRFWWLRPCSSWRRRLLSTCRVWDWPPTASVGCSPSACILPTSGSGSVTPITVCSQGSACS